MKRKTVEVFIDADWTGSIEDRRSTARYCNFVQENLVTWSMKQNIVARSTAEVEFKEMTRNMERTVNEETSKRTCYNEIFNQTM